MRLHNVDKYSKYKQGHNVHPDCGDLRRGRHPIPRDATSGQAIDCVEAGEGRHKDHNVMQDHKDPLGGRKITIDFVEGAPGF